MNHPRRTPLPATILLGLTVALALAGCGRATGAAAPVATIDTTPIRYSLTAADGQRLDATEQTLADQPAITASAARAKASAAVPNAARATAVATRYVALTLDSDKTTRNVWLVTYSGVEFTPGGCSCHADLTTPNTVVAVDGQTGAIALIFGREDQQ